MLFLASYLIASVVFHISSGAGLPFSQQARLCLSSEGAEEGACFGHGREPRLWRREGREAVAGWTPAPLLP